MICNSLQIPVNRVLNCYHELSQFFSLDKQRTGLARRISFAHPGDLILRHQLKNHVSGRSGVGSKSWSSRRTEVQLVGYLLYPLPFLAAAKLGINWVSLSSPALFGA